TIAGSIKQVGNVAVGGARRGALLGHTHEAPCHASRQFAAAPSREVVAEAGFDEDATGHRRLPGKLLNSLEPVLVSRGFRRSGRSAAIDEAALIGLMATGGGVDGPRRSGTRPLLVPIHVELVARRRLCRQAQARDRPTGGGSALACRIRDVGPFRSVAGIRIGVHSGYGLVRALIPDIQEVPKPIVLSRA